jgi:hypothetical protein
MLATKENSVMPKEKDFEHFQSFLNFAGYLCKGAEVAQSVCD